MPQPTLVKLELAHEVYEPNADHRYECNFPSEIAVNPAHVVALVPPFDNCRYTALKLSVSTACELERRGYIYVVGELDELMEMLNGRRPR